MGLMLAEPGFHTRCFVEWEEYPRRSIIAAQRAGYFAPAPIWDDLTTFDARPFAGAIDTLVAGYPCQPFSMAGKRLGENDPRHLWPHVARVARELGNGLRWVFLENVSGHLTLGGETVLRTLWDMGFAPAAGTFSAAETGAPHERQRLFIVAHRAGRGCGILGDAAQPGRGGYADGGDEPMADAQNDYRRREQPAGSARCGRPGLAGNIGAAVDNPAGARCDGARVWPETNGQGWECVSGDGCDDMADTNRCHGDGSGIRGQGWRAEPANSGLDLADASCAGSQGREQPGSPDQRHRQAAPRSTAERGCLPLFPPGPGDRDAWAAVIGASPDRAPALARRDAATAAINLAAILAPDTAEAIEPATRGLDGIAELAEVVGQAGRMVDQAAAFARFRGVADGLALRTRALRLLGNGVHPLAAAYAWRTLAAAHGLGRVDLAAACDGADAHPDRDGVLKK